MLSLILKLLFSNKSKIVSLISQKLLSLFEQIIQLRKKLFFKQKVHLNDLPDDILYDIICRLVCPKTLMHFYLACKNFAYLVPDTDKLMLQYMRGPAFPKPSQFGFLGDFFKNLFAKIWLLLSLPKMTKQVDSLPKVPELLKKFKELKHLHIHYGPNIHEKSRYLLQWKAVFGSQFEGFLLLHADSVHKTKDFDVWRQDLDGAVRNVCFQLARFFLGHPIVMFLDLPIQKILIDHPKLCSIVISDSLKAGKVCMGAEQLARFRQTPHLNLYKRLDESYKVEMRYKAVLELQSCVLKEVKLVRIVPVNQEEPTQALSMEGLDDGEGWEVFNEALKKMMIQGTENIGIAIRQVPRRRLFEIIRGN